MHKFCFVLILILSACSSSHKQEQLAASQIIQQAIDSSGTSKFKNSVVKFQFRDYTYKSIPTCSGIKLQRSFKNDSFAIKDELYEGKFKRIINKRLIEVTDSLANLYSESINSVHYFVQLPFRLKDEAVQTKLIGTEKDELNTYYKIQVSFQQDGGGQDFEDVYYYWINTNTFQISYLAYSFQVNGGGIRFRKAIEYENVNGIQFITYENYKPNFNHAKVGQALNDFLNGKYIFLSLIENKHILVNNLKLDC